MVLREVVLRSPVVRRIRMRLRWSRFGHAGSPTWTARQWCVLLVAVATSVMVAFGSGGCRTSAGVDPHVREMARQAGATLMSIPVTAHRPARTDYDRSAFGSAWTDAVTVTGGRNGCDTRNDVLARDLDDVRTGPLDSCPRGVLAGELRSPYTGAFVVFRRDRGASSIQIDHIVPLAYAWDMGAWSWTPERRQDFANDPANLVAVDGRSNQDKSDAEPGRWMPRSRGFWCQYAIQFVLVSANYHLSIDERSRAVLLDALRCR